MYIIINNIIIIIIIMIHTIGEQSNAFDVKSKHMIGSLPSTNGNSPFLTHSSHERGTGPT